MPEPRGSRQRFDRSQYRLVPWTDEAAPGMLFIDRVGPWFDEDGSEIVLPCSEAFEAAIEHVPGTWTIRSNIVSIDQRTVEIGFPELTLLAQHEWDRMADEDQAPRFSFLLQLGGPQATIGRVCEQLIVGVLLDSVGPELWPEGRVVDTLDAIDAGILRQPSAGARTDDVTIIGPTAPIALVEVKATVRGWAGLRRPVRDRALAQLQATAAANPELELDLVVVAASLRDRRIGVFRLPAHEEASTSWLETYVAWRPSIAPA
jgi:hypothetical protein